MTFLRTQPAFCIGIVIWSVLIMASVPDKFPPFLIPVFGVLFAYCFNWKD